MMRLLSGQAGEVILLLARLGQLGAMCFRGCFYWCAVSLLVGVAALRLAGRRPIAGRLRVLRRLVRGRNHADR